MRNDTWPRRVGLAAAWAVCLVLSGRASPAAADFQHVDGSFGLSLSLPDGTAVSRLKSPAGQTGTEIGQFTLPDGNTVGRIVVSDLPAEWTFEKAVGLVREQLAKDNKVPNEQVSSAKLKVQGHCSEAELLQTWDEAGRLHNGILIAQGPSRQLFVLYVATRETTKETGRRAMEKLAGGFVVLARADDEERLQAALTCGLEWLLSLAAPAPKSEDLWAKQYFLIQAAQEPYGYIVVTEQLQEKNKKPGLAMVSEKWIFWPAGGVEYELQQAFASWDLQEEEWLSRAEVVVEEAGQKPRLATQEQKVLRIKQSLVIQADDKGKGSTGQNRVVEGCPRSFLPMAWKWLAPRLLARKGPADEGAAAGWLATVAYSPLRRGLETQMFSRSVHGSTRQVVQREGLYGATDTWQFEPDGQVRQIQSAGFRLIPASEGQIKAKFAARIALWREKLGTKK